VTGLGGSMEQRLRSTKISDQTAGQDIRVGLWKGPLPLPWTTQHSGMGLTSQTKVSTQHCVGGVCFLGVIGGTLFLALLAACVVRSVAFCGQAMTEVGSAYCLSSLPSLRCYPCTFYRSRVLVLLRRDRRHGPITSSHLRRPRLKCMKSITESEPLHIAVIQPVIPLYTIPLFERLADCGECANGSR